MRRTHTTTHKAIPSHLTSSSILSEDSAELGGWFASLISWEMMKGISTLHLYRSPVSLSIISTQLLEGLQPTVYRPFVFPS